MADDRFTKPDPFLKTDQELLELINYRMSLPTSETGIQDFSVMQGAIGALFVGQRYGLRILRLIHSSKTLRQYEKFYGDSFENLIPQHGEYIDRSFAWRIITTTKEYAGKYWDIVSRKLPMDTDKKRFLVDTAHEVQ